MFADLAVPFDEAAYARHYSPNWYRFYERLGLPKELWTDADEAWLRYYHEESPDKREGADEALAAVRAAGRALGLVTSGDRARVDSDLRRLGWASTFEVTICGGEPVVKGTRVTVRTILASLAEGASIQDILDDFPTLT